MTTKNWLRENPGVIVNLRQTRSNLEILSRSDVKA